MRPPRDLQLLALRACARLNKWPEAWLNLRAGCLATPESLCLRGSCSPGLAQVIVSIHASYGVRDLDGPSVPPSSLGRLYLDQAGMSPGRPDA